MSQNAMRFLFKTKIWLPRAHLEEMLVSLLFSSPFFLFFHATKDSGPTGPHEGYPPVLLWCGSAKTSMEFEASRSEEARCPTHSTVTPDPAKNDLGEREESASAGTR